MITFTHSDSSPALSAYKVYHLSSVKLDREARRQTPDLGRLVAHATIIDNVRRWSRSIACPTETVLVDSDPFEDSSSDEEEFDADSDDIGEVAVFEIEMADSQEWSGRTDPPKTYEITSTIVEEKKSQSVPAPKRRPPPPPPTCSTYDIKDHSWRQNRPVTVREIAIEDDGDN